MVPVKPPPLIPCCDETGHGLNVDDFQALFGYLYVGACWYVTPPRIETLRVVFHPHHFDHAFFKEPDKGQRRTVWKPDRAERLLWIGYTVENPSEVYRVGTSRLNLFCRMGDRAAPWYLVVIDRTGEVVATFTTAYPMDHRNAVGKSKIGVPLDE